MALTVGLTGGIGAGKSLAAVHFARLGAVLVDADTLAREVLAPGAPGLAAITAEFGSTILLPDGTLDRQGLAERVFDDPAARQRLDAITHPLVRERTRQLMAEAPTDAIVVNDVPLLVESGLAPGFHLVAVVFADEIRRLTRLTENRGMSLPQAQARLAAQASDVDRRVVADIVLHNESSPAALHEQVERVWHERLVPFRDNLVARRGAPALDAVVPYAPRWAAEAARVVARLRRALPDATDLRHLGPTAVPGSAAPDVLRFDALLPPTASVGVRERLAEAGWFPTDSPPDASRVDGGVAWFVSADPGRPALLRCVTSGD